MAAQLLVPRVDGTGKGLEFGCAPDALAVEGIVFLGAVVQVQGQGAAEIGGALLEQITLGALDQIAGGCGAVLGGNADRLEGAVIHGEDAAGIDALFDVGGIVHLLGFPKQATM